MFRLPVYKMLDLTVSFYMLERLISFNRQISETATFRENGLANETLIFRLQLRFVHCQVESK